MGDEVEGVAGVAVWPVRQGGECAGESNGFGIGHQVAGQQGGGGAACGGQVGAVSDQLVEAGVPAVGEMVLVVVPAGGDGARSSPGGGSSEVS